MVRKLFVTPYAPAGAGVTCRTLRMPNQREWLGIFNNALLQTTQAWQYEQVDALALTIDETIVAMQAILDEFWANSTCDSPSLPSGEPVVKLDALGRWQQLIEGNWEPPTGDYTLPPVPPRTTGTDEDKLCLASANATEVLRLLYENVTDSVTAGLPVAEAIISFTLAVLALIVAPVYLLASAILAIAAIVFSVFFDIANLISSDFWDVSFTDKVKCALYECAVVDGAGVVTFDYNCVTTRLANAVDLASGPEELLLFGQILYMLQWIGAQGLDHAGATTSITTADCSECETVWCYTFDFTEGNGGFSAVLGSYTGAGWTSGTVTGGGVTYRYFDITRTAPDGIYTSASMTYDVISAGYNVPNTDRIYAPTGAPANWIATQTSATGTNKVLTWTGAPATNPVLFGFVGVASMRTGSTAGGSAILKSVTFTGIGANPFGSDNCPP